MLVARKDVQSVSEYNPDFEFFQITDEVMARFEELLFQEDTISDLTPLMKVATISVLHCWLQTRTENTELVEMVILLFIFIRQVNRGHLYKNEKSILFA